MSDSIESVQLAPHGVVTDIYHAEGNEAGKIDLLHDKDRGEISCYARDNHTVITQGPFELKQGDYGIAVRNPVYLNDENGQEYFWGFTIVILRVPVIFSDSISALSNFGLNISFQKQTLPGVTHMKFLSVRWKFNKSSSLHCLHGGFIMYEKYLLQLEEAGKIDRKSVV